VWEEETDKVGQGITKGCRAIIIIIIIAITIISP
jgi:hypothetical protein